MVPPTLPRRRFLLAAAALTTTDLSFRQVWAAQSKEPRKLHHCLSNEAYSFNSLLEQNKLTLLSLAELHRTLDIRGVSFHENYFKSWDKDYLDRILESFKSQDRLITSLMMGGNLATADEEARKKRIASNIAKLKAAGYLGVPVVRMNPGGVAKGEDNSKEGVDRVVAAFREILPIATDLGIRITIENHGGVAASVENILAVLHRTDPKAMGCTLDFGNEPVSQRPEVFKKLAPYAWHTHAKLESFRSDGEATDSDYGKLLGILKAADYPGAVSIEWEGKGECVDGVRRTRALILKHWPDLPN